jgi:dTDP-4-dehydrorhamnose reductase
VKRILLLGKNGQVGWELQRALAPLADVVALDRGEVEASHNGDSTGDRVLCGDLSRLDELEATVRAVAPDVVVNAAAYTAVDEAEKVEGSAHCVNASAPGILARACKHIGAWLVHYSTDYVFDGRGTRPWKEEDPISPLNVYGRTKFEGEERIRQSDCLHLILRTSWVYAARGTNFVRTMLRLATERDVLRVIDDQFGAPTGAELIADSTAHALRSAFGRSEISGTYHVAARGETTWFEYARHVIEGARRRRWPLRVAPDAILPVPTDAYPVPARRPENSRLDCTKFERSFRLRLPAWQDGVDRVLDELTLSRQLP